MRQFRTYWTALVEIFLLCLEPPLKIVRPVVLPPRLCYRPAMRLRGRIFRRLGA